MGLGDPARFYDAIITAGFALRTGEVGTLGELSPKPHPWLYAQVFRIGLGLTPERRTHVIGIEDSAAGVCAVRLAGFAAIGVAGGNIGQSGLRPLCHRYCADLDEVADSLP
jgi:beta-phosphoglucomutase-like phosphatase (HAD superfamily)